MNPNSQDIPTNLEMVLPSSKKPSPSKGLIKLHREIAKIKTKEDLQKEQERLESLLA